MKITQTIEIQIKDQTLILTKEEAQELADTLYKTLGIKAKTTNLLQEYEKLKQKEDKTPILPAWPQNPMPTNPLPHYPTFPPDYPRIWCGTGTLDTKTQ